jgi:cytochrome P450
MILTAGEKMEKFAPGPRGFELLKSVFAMGNDYSTEFMNLYEKYGPIVCLKGQQPKFLIFHPDGIQRVFKENFKNYRRGGGEFQGLFGDGLLASEGKQWQASRQMLGPLFTGLKVKSYVQSIYDSLDEAIVRLDRRAASGEVFDLVPAILELVLAISSKSLFGGKIDHVSSDFLDGYTYYSDYAARRSLAVIKVPSHIPTPGNIKAKQALKKIDTFVYRKIEERRKDTRTSGDDILSRLIHLNHPMTQKSLGDKEIRDHLTTMLVASHDTTSFLIIWMIYILAQQKTWAEKILTSPDYRDEGYLRAEQDFQFPLLRQVTLETLRLYPAVPATYRFANEADEILGYKIPKDAMLLMSMWVTHRMPEYWARPQEFIPERFLQEPAHPYQFIPFGGGPRRCIGEQMGHMMAATCVLRLLYRYEFHLESTEAKIHSGISLHPKGGLNLRLSMRATNSLQRPVDRLPKTA